MTKKAGCTACVGGHVFICLKYVDLQRVHMISLPCRLCNSDSSEVLEPTDGGIEIEEKEFRELVALGWTDPDI